MEEHFLTVEFKAIQIRLDYLTQAVTELKNQNEDRRASIDAVANSIRAENRQHSERCTGIMEGLKGDVEKLKVEISITRWVGVVLGGTVLTLTTYKLLNAEPNINDHDHLKPGIERIIRGSVNPTTDLLN